MIGLLSKTISLEPRAALAVLNKKEGEMRKVLAELDAEQRAALLCVVDFAIAICASGLVVGLIRLIVDVLQGA